MCEAGVDSTDPKAMFSYARVLEDGRGCDGDEDLASSFASAAVPKLLELAVAGDPTAQFYMGEAYYNGLGVEDSEGIAMWFYR